LLARSRARHIPLKPGVAAAEGLPAFETLTCTPLDYPALVQRWDELSKVLKQVLDS